MKIAVVGSRDFANLADVRHYTRRLASNGCTIVTGGARGVDQEAQRAAEGLGYHVVVFKPDYESHGSAAPLIRNTRIVEEADAVVAFWDGRSTGTLDTIRKAVKAGKTVTINPKALA